MQLTSEEQQFLINKITSGEPVPDDFKEKIFPTLHKEYELRYAGKMRKQDILRGEDGVLPVPLQVEKTFNGVREPFSDGWRNIIVFGDNLQFLKTCNQNTDELIKDKVKSKVKLIYIDPPFATEGEFKSKSGAQAYTDKTKGAEFIEFLRRRLVVARELLANDGYIVVHLDYKKGHYIKVLLDEIFGEHNFRNEIYAKRKTKNLQNQFDKVRQLNVSSDTLFLYSKNPETRFTVPKKEKLKDLEGEDQWNNFYNNANRPTLRYEILGINLTEGQWRWNQDRAFRAVDNYKEYQKKFSDKLSLYEYWDETGRNKEFIKRDPESTRCYYWVTPKEEMNTDTNWSDMYAYDNSPGSYPTQKSEVLLSRLIATLTTEGDLVLDFFGGGGTTAIVAEKLGRKWITCDIGKLSFYSMQKRVLSIQDSKVIDGSKRYGKQAKSFITVNVGYYDLAKLFELGQEKYVRFVLNLFEVEQYSHIKTIKGYKIHGERNGSYCFVWEFWKYKTEANVDLDFLDELHSNLKNSIGKRFYIIAPANAIDFISDYHEIDDIRYYFLKVPYHVIQELHKEQFKKFRQPQSKNKINDVEDAIGFHFTRQPEVRSSLNGNILSLHEFKSNYTEEGTDREMENFESLSMIIIDNNFNGREFCMTEFHFAADLLKMEKIDDHDLEQQIREGLKKQQELKIAFKKLGDKVCIKYIDIYGNEFTEELKTTDN